MMGSSAGARPGTASTKAAGYGTRGTPGDGRNAKSSAPPSFAKRADEGNVDETCREVERKVHELLEESARFGVRGARDEALERARECVKEEKRLSKLRDRADLVDPRNADLRFAVTLNLAHRLRQSGFKEEALETYEGICARKRSNTSSVFGGDGGSSEFPKRAHRVRVDLGNARYESNDYPAAIKQYRMALDQVSSSDKETRAKITRNIACAFARMGQYTDAASTFEDVIDLNSAAASSDVAMPATPSGSTRSTRTPPDVVTFFNLVVCHYATGDPEKMRRAFTSLLRLRAYEDDADDEDDEDSLAAGLPKDGANASKARVAFEPNDALRMEIRVRRNRARETVAKAARLIGPEIAATPELGYELLAEEMRRCGYVSLANELEMAKAVGFLRQKSAVSRGGFGGGAGSGDKGGFVESSGSPPTAFEEGRATLTSFEKKDDLSIVAEAATNLSFLYLAEEDLEKAGSFSGLAVERDGVDARALVNRGCFFLRKAESAEKQPARDTDDADADAEASRKERLLREALSCFEAASEIDGDGVEAIFNRGLTLKRLGDFPEAVALFKKVMEKVPLSNENNGDALCTLRPGVHVEALYHIADMSDAAGDVSTAIACYETVVRKIGNDPNVLARLGKARAVLGDDQKALQYYQEAHRAYPVDVNVLVWLGTFHARCARFESARDFFDLAAQARPEARSKWLLAAASCVRKSGETEEALRRYLAIHGEFPGDVECLRHLAHVCGDLGMDEDAQKYAAKLRKAERERVEKGEPAGVVKKTVAPAAVPRMSAAAPASPSPLERSRSGVSEDEWGGADLELPGM